jgi:hypothetical protein
MTDLLPHPWLYAGLDDTAFARDEINGAGGNDWLWVLAFDGSYVPEPMITTIPFSIECPDFTVQAETTVFHVPAETLVLCVGDD